MRTSVRIVTKSCVRSKTGTQGLKAGHSLWRIERGHKWPLFHVADSGDARRTYFVNQIVEKQP
jgi:hypothetical protein